MANEIVNLLQVGKRSTRMLALHPLNNDAAQTLGRMFNISDAILGLTVLACGNSIGGDASTPYWPAAAD